MEERGARITVSCERSFDVRPWRSCVGEPPNPDVVSWQKRRQRARARVCTGEDVHQRRQRRVRQLAARAAVRRRVGRYTRRAGRRRSAQLRGRCRRGGGGDCCKVVGEPRCDVGGAVVSDVRQLPLQQVPQLLLRLRNVRRRHASRTRLIVGQNPAVQRDDNAVTTLHTGQREI